MKRLIIVGHKEMLYFWGQYATIQENQITNAKSVCSRKHSVSLKWATIQDAAIKKPDYFYDSFPDTSMTKRRVGH
jgi:hypothetical protein